MIRRTLVIALPAGLAVAALILFQPQPTQKQTLTTPAGSDYYLLDATVEQYNPDGSLRYAVDSSRSLHFPDDSAHLSGIRVHYPEAKHGLWQLTAARGRVPPGSRNILLSGGVVLIRHPGAADALRLTTARAWVRTAAERADTEAPVTARGSGANANADGFTVWFHRDKLILHHNVQVVYSR